MWIIDRLSASSTNILGKGARFNTNAMEMECLYLSECDRSQRHQRIEYLGHIDKLAAGQMGRRGGSAPRFIGMVLGVG